jgi:hypothetical protein
MRKCDLAGHTITLATWSVHLCNQAPQPPISALYLEWDKAHLWLQSVALLSARSVAAFGPLLSPVHIVECHVCQTDTVWLL